MKNDERAILSVLKRGAPHLGAAGCGLYVSRVLVEFGPFAWPWPAPIFLGLGLALAGAYLARLLPRSLAILLGLSYLYVFYPHINAHWAAAAGFMAIIAMVDDADLIGLRTSSIVDILVFAGSLAIYIWTLAPTVLPADSGEFQLVARTLGIAHPPGYPLYTLLGYVFTLLPVGDAAYRVNLMSAVFAALTLALLVRMVRTLSGSATAGLVGAVALGGATTFWAQATTANIRSLVALLTVALLATLLRFERTRAPRDLALAAFVFGLGVTHHGSLGFLALPIALFLLATGPRRLADPRLIASSAGAFAVSLLVLLYLPLRGATDAPLNPGGLTTPGGFLRHVLALGFEGDMFYFANLASLPDRLAVLAEILRLELGWPLLGATLIAALLLTWRRPRASLLLAGVFLVNAFVAITYRAPQTVEYLMPAYVALALILGSGIVIFRSRLIQTVLLALLLFVAVDQAWTHLPSFRMLSTDRTARSYGESLLQAAPTGATVLANWHYATPLWYLQRIEGLRPDVRVSYVVPRGAEPIGRTWRRRTDEAVAAGPTIVTNRYADFSGAAYRLDPLAGAYRTVSMAENRFLQANELLPADATRTEVLFGDRLRLAGYRLELTGLQTNEIARVMLYWEPIKIEQDYAVFVHLVDGEGVVWGQADRGFSRAQWDAGPLRVDLPILRLPHVPPGRYQLVTGVYVRTGDRLERLASSSGGDSLRLAEVNVDPLPDGPITQHPLHKAFLGGPTLMGIDYETGLPGRLRVYLHWAGASGEVVQLQAGGVPVARGELPRAPFATTAYDLPATPAPLELEVAAATALGPWRFPLGSRVGLPGPAPGERFLVFGGEMALIRAGIRPAGSDLEVDLDFLALRPLTQDYTVSVQVEGPGWHAQDDSTPAWGAIPTLKWVGGMRVHDRHRIRLPEGASGPVRITLTIYNAFTQAPLPVLDEGLMKLGQGTAVELATIEGFKGN